MDPLKEKILEARELRAKEIEKRFADGNVVVALRANIPGDDKNIKEAYMLIRIFYNFLVLNSVKQEFFESADGPYYLFVFTSADGYLVKQVTKQIEEGHPLGRFVDIDVYQENHDISRKIKRRCFLCNDLAVNCIVSKKHTLEEVLTFLTEHVNSYVRSMIEQFIFESIKLELDLDPKFGLVTPKTKGSHNDMDYDLMMKAAKSIIPVFMEMYDFANECKNIDKLFQGARNIGLKAEKLMFEATNNINAYKGLIFNLGLFVSAFSYMIDNPKEKQDMFEIIKHMTQYILNDFENESDSFGHLAYKEHNILGARGEAYQGFPHVKAAMTYLSYFSEEERTETLAYLISTVEDTTLLKRAGSYEKYMNVKSKFKALTKYDKLLVEQLNTYCLENNLSFGGSADLLITTIFFRKLNNFYKL